MLNEKRVKHMVKLASYEEKGGTEDIKISSYFKKDYVSFNVIVTLLWLTLGYLSLVALVCFATMKELVENMSFTNMMLLIVIIAALYVFLMLVYGVCAVRYYKKKHQKAQQGVKRYIKDLEYLEKMYESEDA